MSKNPGFICELCGKEESRFKCSACNSVRYCNKDHQKQHWPQHKKLCKILRKKPSTSGAATEVDIQHNLEKELDKIIVDFAKSKITDNNKVESASNLAEKDFILDHGDADERKISSSSEPDLGTPIDSSDPSDANKMLDLTPQPNASTPCLFRLELCPDIASRLAEKGFSTSWLDEIISLVVGDLNKFGVCVIDNLLGDDRAHKVLDEVKDLHQKGYMQDGQVVSRSVRSRVRGQIRGDKTTWVTGQEPECSNISQLINIVDTVISRSNRAPKADKLAQYDIKLRTRAMVACYPGVGTHYVKHVDNPNADGRCITAIYYVNEAWCKESGGFLRIFPEAINDQIMEIEPKFDRMLFFWSDRRNPHEVLPAYKTRYAITMWYLDQKEREVYQQKMRNQNQR